MKTAKMRPQFVHLESRHICKMCNKALIKPVQTSCGERVCDACIKPLFKGRDTIPCPLTHQEDELEEECANRLTIHDIHSDTGTAKEIEKLLVYCPNSITGCTKTMPWMLLKEHLNTCPKEPKLPTECVEMENSNALQLSPHTINQPITGGPCYYKTLGCKYKGTTANDLLNHYNGFVRQHLHIVTAGFTALKRNVESLIPQPKEVPEWKKKHRKLELVVAKIKSKAEEQLQTCYQDTEIGISEALSVGMREINNINTQVDKLKQYVKGIRRKMRSELTGSIATIKKALKAFTLKASEYDKRLEHLEVNGQAGVMD